MIVSGRHGIPSTSGISNAHTQYANSVAAALRDQDHAQAAFGVALQHAPAAAVRGLTPPGPTASVRLSSAWRLPAATNTAANVTTSTNQRDSATGAATPPATARSTKPPAIAKMSSSSRWRQTSV